jgi:hypothetical protein
MEAINLSPSGPRANFYQANVSPSILPAFRVWAYHVHDVLGRELGGDGTPGGNRVDRFFRLFGGTGGDCTVHLNDLGAFLGTYGKSQGDAAYRWYLWGVLNRRLAPGRPPGKPPDGRNRSRPGPV